MNKFNNEYLEEEFNELLNTGKISHIWFDACDEKWWEKATWEDFFTGEREQILFNDSSYLPQYINKMHYIFKILLKLQKDIQVGNDIEMRFFSELMLSDYLTVKYEKKLERKYLLSSYYNSKVKVQKEYIDNKVRSINFATPFILATTKLLNLWMEKRNLFILKEAQEFSKKNIVFNKYENEIENLKQAFSENKDCNLAQFRESSANVIIYSSIRINEFEEMKEKWVHNIRGASYCVIRFALKEYNEVKNLLNQFDDTFKALESIDSSSELYGVFKRYKSIFDREFDFLLCLKKQFSIGVPSLDVIKRLVEKYSNEKKLSNYRKKLLIATLTVSFVLDCTRCALTLKNSETKLQAEETFIPALNDNKSPNRPHLPNDKTNLEDKELSVDEPKNKEKVYNVNPSTKVQDFTEMINVGKYIEFEDASFYGSIYDNNIKGIASGKGYIIAYFPYKYISEKKEYLGSLRSVNELNQFLEQHASEINDIYWKVAFVDNFNIDEIRTFIDNQEVVPAKYTTYFIDYDPFIREIKK